VNLQNRPWLVLAGSAVILLCFWQWATKILAPAYGAKVLATRRPIGNNSDLYPRWLGARELLLHGRNPYSPQITREIQSGFYGRPLDPNNPSDPSAREAFVYPLYVVFLLSPAVTLPFATVALIARWVLLAAIACSVPLWMYALKLHARKRYILAATLLALASFPAAEEYFQHNLAALSMLFLAAAAAAATRKWLSLCGFLLALATIKPDAAALVIFWFLLWAVGSWKQRSRLVWSFTLTLAALLISSEALLRGWIPQFLSAVREYPTYGADPSILQLFLPGRLSDILTAALIIFSTVIFWWRRKSAIDSEAFSWTLAWAATVTLVVLPKQAAYNQLLLIPALLLFAHRCGNFAGTTFLARVAIKGALACQLWQWAAATVLALASLVLPSAHIRIAAEVPMYTLLALPPLTFLAVAFCAAPRKSPVPDEMAPTSDKIP
jgi:hypothetical protein